MKSLPPRKPWGRPEGKKLGRKGEVIEGGVNKGSGDARSNSRNAKKRLQEGEGQWERESSRWEQARLVGTSTAEGNENNHWEREWLRDETSGNRD